MLNASFTVLDLIDLDLKEHNSLNLRCLGGRRGLSRKIEVPEINRPGLALNGFFDVFAGKRIQVFGRGESAYLEKMKQQLLGNVSQLLAYDIPCCIFSCSQDPDSWFMDAAESAGCPILQTDVDTTEFVARLIRVLATIFAPRKSMHGVLVEVYGIGVLLIGESGVGKSETALELIKAGHRLVADDVVEIRCVNGNMLIGAGANRIIGHHMEIRGIGVINVTHLFGVGAIRDKKQIDMVIELEVWDSSKKYDRIGDAQLTMDILGVSIHKLTIPVRSERSNCIIVETAVMNERLKSMGYDCAKEFNRNILKWIESETAKSVYFGQEDTI
jgi:HPr kinase/phosphorylase